MATRVVQKVGIKGSLRWMQAPVNQHTATLNAAVGATLGIPANQVEWRSPLAADDYAEYRDQGFLDLLGVKLDRHPLRSFWPDRGPQWDALGRTPTGGILVEAKAHAGELNSTCAAGSVSGAKIRRSLDDVKNALGATISANWMTPYYQYANRIAHLYLLRELNGVEADLVMLCFLNDWEMGGPTTTDQWMSALALVHAALGLGSHPLSAHIHHVFIDVTGMTESREQQNCSGFSLRLFNALSQRAF